MKVIKLAYIILCTAVIHAQDNTHNKSVLNPQRLKEVEAWVFPSVYCGNLSEEEKRQRDEYYENCKQEIIKAIDIKPYLFYLLEREYLDKEARVNGTTSVLTAISYRNDLTDEDLAPILQELWRIIKNPINRIPDPSQEVNRLAYVENLYLEGGTHVIATKKSKEHEELAIEILKRGEELKDIFIINFAAETLAKIGSNESFPKVEAVIHKINKIDRFRKWAEKMQKILDENKKQIIQKDKQANEVPERKVNSSNNYAVQPPQRKEIATPWGAVSVTLLVAFGLTWTIVKRTL